MSNSDRCRLRQRANDLKREIAAQRTQEIQDRIDQVRTDPRKMDFLAHLFVFWEKEFTHAPGATYEQQREHRALLALDWAMQIFSRENWDLTSDPGEFIKNAEAPFHLPDGWSFAQTDAKWKNFSTLPQQTWRYVFFQNKKPVAGFDSIAACHAFFGWLRSQGHDVNKYDTDRHLTRKEAAAAKGLRFIALPDGLHWHVYKIHADSNTVANCCLMPSMCHPEIEEQIARRIADTLNAAVAENDAFRANKRAEKEAGK